MKFETEFTLAFSNLDFISFLKQRSLIEKFFLMIVLAVIISLSTARQMMWISGSDSANQFGIYGQQGVPDPSNHPGARESASSCIDSNNNLYLFGGDGKGESTSGTLLCFCFLII